MCESEHQPVAISNIVSRTTEVRVEVVDDGVLMSDEKYPESQTPSPETLRDLNPEQLVQRIRAAEEAIFSRLQRMRTNSIELLEGQAIQDALDGLLRLTKDTLEFADSLLEVTRASDQAWA
jgi:hypothetical protein